jgi:hypothetical protein
LIAKTKTGCTTNSGNPTGKTLSMLLKNGAEQLTYNAKLTGREPQDQSSKSAASERSG